MKRRLFEELEIETYSTDTYPLPIHSHTYYELIYIYKGSGRHHFNKLVVPYAAGDVFLLSPDDEHYFEILKTTRFCFIKFTDSFFQQDKDLFMHGSLDLFPIALMKNAHWKEEKLRIPQPYRKTLKNLIDNIAEYQGLQELSHSPLLYHQILSVFGLLVETNLQQEKTANKDVIDKEQLIYYIHQHIYQPSAIRIKAISEQFHIAENYFGAYFKRNFEISYKKYIDAYRSKLIESRVRSGQMTLKQIAAEFGFSDESHLCHYLKKWDKPSPGSLRKKPVATEAPA